MRKKVVGSKENKDIKIIMEAKVMIIIRTTEIENNSKSRHREKSTLNNSGTDDDDDDDEFFVWHGWPTKCVSSYF